MQNEEFIQIQGELPYAYYFMYKHKKYPINLDLFKGYSKFFSQNQKEIEYNRNIQLIDEQSERNFNITEENIISFIKFVHRERISLTLENAAILNYLGNKYQIDILVEYTEKYIDKHQKELAIDILTIYQNDEQFNTQTFEDILSRHLLEHIHDDRLLTLNFPLLYRILNKYEEEVPNENKNDEIIEFYFKCLDKYGREASILFKGVDFQNAKVEYLDRLTTKYSKIFDFHFINSAFVKTIYEMQNELFLVIKEERTKRKEQEQLIDELKERIQSIEQASSYEKHINRSVFNDLDETTKINSFNKLDNETQIKFFNEINQKSQILIMNNLDSKTQIFIFSKLEEQNQISLMNEINEQAQFSIFNQIDNKNQFKFFTKLEQQVQLSIMNKLNPKSQFQIFDQMKHETKLSMLNKLEQKSQLSIFTQLKQNVQLSIFNLLETNTQISIILLGKCRNKYTDTTFYIHSIRAK